MKRAHTFTAVASTAKLVMYIVVFGMLGLPATGIAGSGDSLTCTLESNQSSLRWIPVLNDYDPTQFLVRLTATNNTGMNLSDLSFEIEWTDPSALDLLELDPGVTDNDRIKGNAVLLAGMNLSLQWAFRLRGRNTTGSIVRIPFTVRYTARELGAPMSPFAKAEIEIWPVTTAVLQCVITAPDSIHFHQGAYDPAQFEVGLRVENTGSEQARNVRAFLLPSSGFTPVSTSTRDLGNIDAGAVVKLEGTDAFRLRPNTRQTSGTDTIRVLVSSSAGDFETAFPVWVERSAQARLELQCAWNGTLRFDPRINDYDPNPLAIPVHLRNAGDAPAMNVELSVMAASGIVPFRGVGNVTVGTLEPGEEYSLDWLMEVLRRDVQADVTIRFSAEYEDGTGGGTLLVDCQTAVTVPVVLAAELVCETRVDKILYNPQSRKYDPDPFRYSLRVTNVGNATAYSLNGMIILPPQIQFAAGENGGPEFPDSLQPGESSDWLTWNLSVAGLFPAGDSVSICSRVYDVYNVQAFCCDRIFIPGRTQSAVGLSCESELQRLEVDVRTGSYVQDRFKVILRVTNTSGRSVFDVQATMLSFDHGLRGGGSPGQLVATRLEPGAPAVEVDWELLAGPHDTATLAEIRFLVSAKDAQGNLLSTEECVVHVEIPALPRASLSCVVRTDVTSPPDDITIAWDMNTKDYEGSKSAFGDYSVVTVTATVTNAGGGQADRVRAMLLIPENMVLDNGEQAIKLTQPSDIAPGETATASWSVRVLGGCLNVQRSIEVMVTPDQGTPTRCSLPIIIAEKPCMVNLDLPEDVVGTTGSTVVVPIFFRSSAIEPLQRYRLMIGFDQEHLDFLDAVAEGSRTEAGWRGPRATVLPDPADNRRAIVLVDDLTLQSDAAIDMGEEGVLVYLRFEVAFDPEFVLSGRGNVTQSALDFVIDVTLPGSRRIIGAFNTVEESEYGTVMNAYSPGMVTVTSPCAWPLQWTARLEGNRPNPFNPSTTIAYTLEMAAPVTLAVFDIFGREIRRIDSGLRSAGRHEAVFDAGDLPGGVYFYRLQTPVGSAVRRMLLLR